MGKYPLGKLSRVSEVESIAAAAATVTDAAAAPATVAVAAASVWGHG